MPMTALAIARIRTALAFEAMSNLIAVRPLPSRPGELHPEPLTDPDLTLSRHPARATTRRLPPSVENWSAPPVASWLAPNVSAVYAERQEGWDVPKRVYEPEGATGPR